MRNGYSPGTVAVTAGRPRDPGDPLNSPIVPVSSYRAGGDNRYAREGVEGWEAFETAVGELEGGRAVAFSSGLAAVAAALELSPPAGRVAASRRLYVGSTQLLVDMESRGRFRVDWFDGPDEVGEETPDVVLVEDPANPGLGRIDVAGLALAVEGALLIVDNTVATPIARRPLEMGADVVVHSVTKNLGGHSDLLMGVVVVADPALESALRSYRTLHGSVPGVLESYLALRGVRTLALRMERSVYNASRIASRLQQHPEVESAVHPGIGCLVALELKGGISASDQFIDRLRLWTHATSLGGVESTLERRRRWAVESDDVSESLIRMSVGIEEVEDLWDDLQQSLDQMRG